MSNIALGAELKRMRLNKGMSLREVSLATGISNPFLSQIEKHGKVPSGQKLKKLANFYNVSHNHLMAIAYGVDERALPPDTGTMQDVIFSVTDIEANALRSFLSALRTYDLLSTARREVRGRSQ